MVRRKLTRQQEKAIFAKRGTGRKVERFPRDKGLPVRVAIVVPSTKAKDKKISQEEMNQRVKETDNFMRENFGGETTIRGVGSWKDNDGKKVQENVVVVESYSSEEDWKENDIRTEEYLNNKTKEWEQDTITFEYENFKKHEDREGVHFTKEEIE